MAAEPPAVAPPAFDPIVLPELRAADRYDIEAGAMLEAFAFTGMRLETLQLGGARIDGCRFEAVEAGEADLRGATIVETVIERLDVPVVRAARTRWRDVRLEGGRLGSAELYDSEWESVHIIGCKLSFVNLRGSVLRDVQFTDCVIDELDLGACEARRVAFPGSRIRHLDVSRASLSDVDLRGCEFDELTGTGALRGAAIDVDQLSLLAPLLARELGIRVV
jgi:uncharacterized protein YjbI with pentapeptide repeats